MPDTDDLAVDEGDIYLIQHLTPHISATFLHLTGAPQHPESPYAPSFYPPTGYWSSAEKALFFRALSAHSRLRPDLIAASIRTKSTADVVVYLSLLREGVARAEDSDHATIPRDRHPAAHEVSAELVAHEDQHAARICAAEPARAMEMVNVAREEVARTARIEQTGREEAYEQWRGERDIEWAREDFVARLDAVGLQVLDRILRQDEERRDEAGSGNEEEGSGEDHVHERRGSSMTLHPAASVSSRATTSNPSSPLVASILDDDMEDVPDTIQSNLSPTSRRRIYKRLHMRRKRAEASGDVVKLDAARLKPGRKVSTTSKFRIPRVKDEDENLKRRARGDTRPYKIQRELERLGIGAEYLRANGLDLFHLGALGRLMRLYPSLDASRPAGVAETIAAETIQMLHALVAQFMRSLIRRAIAVRELDFALRAHTKVWRLGDRVVRPPHVRRALELSGGARLSKRAHFEGLLERFSGDGDEDEGQDNEDVSLAVRASMRKGKAIARNEQDDDDDDDAKGNGDAGVSDGEQQQQQQQQAGPRKEAQAPEAAELRWSTIHRTMYSPFVYAPDMIAPAHPFGVYAPGTTPESLASGTHARHVMDEDEDEDEDNFMPTETDDEALAVELLAEDRLDEADALADAAYEASVWRELRGGNDADVLLPAQMLGKRGACEEVGGNDVPLPMPARKRKKKNVKSAAVIEDSDLEYLD